jgi:hypothetical protein
MAWTSEGGRLVQTVHDLQFVSAVSRGNRWELGSHRRRCCPGSGGWMQAASPDTAPTRAPMPAAVLPTSQDDALEVDAVWIAAAQAAHRRELSHIAVPGPDPGPGVLASPGAGRQLERQHRQRGVHDGRVHGGDGALACGGEGADDDGRCVAVRMGCAGAGRRVGGGSLAEPRINQPINQPTNQPTNQPASKPSKRTGFMARVRMWVTVTVVKTYESTIQTQSRSERVLGFSPLPLPHHPHPLPLPSPTAFTNSLTRAQRRTMEPSHPTPHPTQPHTGIVHLG